MNVPTAKFVRFREDRYWDGTRPIVGFAAKEMVKSLLSTDEMATLFGGYLEYEDSAGEHRFLGVWGDRKVGRFLRLLRERGALIEVEEAMPSQFRQRHRASR